MALRAGQREQRILIERKAGGQEDNMGALQGVWAAYAKPWAQVFYGTGNERRQAGIEGASQAATFRVLASPKMLSVSPADRIQFDGVWDIKGAVPLGRGGVEITAVKRIIS